MVNAGRRWLCGGLIACCVLLGGCEDAAGPKGASANKAAEATMVRGRTMGTFYSITVPGGFPGGEEALKKLADEKLNTIVSAISTFDPKAELARFNAHDDVTPFPISPLLAGLIEESLHQSKRIDGAMDITIGPLVNLWGFGKDHPRKVPGDYELDAARRLVGADKFELRHTPNEPLLVKRERGVKLDLATIGEGAGADAIAAALDRLGVRDYLVSVAGASRSRGHNPRGELWKIGIEDPTTPDGHVFTTICPLDQAVSTAGSYRNFFIDEKTGRHYSHIIDPHTGRPVEHQTLSVTVVDRAALVTDALDTGLLVWGADKAHAWAERHDMAIYTIEYRDGRPHGRASRAFNQYQRCTQGGNP